MKINMEHGSGGKATSDLISNIFAKHFNNEILNRMEDAAVVPGFGRIAVTTDSFVVTPLFFRGGDIGHLAVCGTVNDLLMGGAVPKYLTCGFIIEEGADMEALDRIAASMAATAKKAVVTIVAGDTKVIEGKGGIYINTAGVGFVPDGVNLDCSSCRAGDVVLVSGNLGDHHAAILSERLSIENKIASDCAPLCEMVGRLMNSGVNLRAMRDVTRGGLATVLNEFAKSSGCMIELEEEKIPVSEDVKGFCGFLGLDPLYMGNEGKMLLVTAPEDAPRALEVMKNSEFGENAAIIGCVKKGDSAVTMRTAIGGVRMVDILYGEGLPRIC
ncbi:hydrogenase expression/formation protein HypE [Acetivibrio sp. MSJd-27]|uniref:hydrogenase expression/formation protein HypE n=1 Tax=Acetivibrio sp. MSJd-27 TaxID=2841523 RepID=UPI001C0FE93B|nr:hydrogenase expression/formation protein HypE [Acetivibrio sp. MSJd-27]MBU5451266.1 hydrogenase expression/formation protein HypE [Acetivibrio sp. MSJd-27]